MTVKIKMKRKLDDLTEKEIMVTLDTLYTAASAVRGRAAVKLFLRDLLTPSERIMLGRRIIIARMILAGETYESIQNKLRVGQATIGRVHRWLRDQLPGYELAIRGLEKEFDQRAAKSTPIFSYAWLKQKYPLHFLLFPQAKLKHKFGRYEE